jgi:hypothetical protein
VDVDGIQVLHESPQAGLTAFQPLCAAVASWAHFQDPQVCNTTRKVFPSVYVVRLSLAVLTVLTVSVCVTAAS